MQRMQEPEEALAPGLTVLVQDTGAQQKCVCVCGGEPLLFPKSGLYP